MSFSFRITFSDGAPAVADVSGTLPASGAIAVNGHSNQNQVSVGAALVDENGAQIIGAYATGRTS